MRQLLGSLLVVSALAACSKSDTGAAATSAAAAPAVAPARPPMAMNQKMAGTWSARAHPAGMPANDTGMAFTIIADTSANSLTINGKDTVKYHRVSMTDSTFVVESSPHMDPMLKTQATDRADGKFAADSMWGTFETKPTKGNKKLLSGTWSAHRKS
ncbi:MAG: hypothetical protein M3081_05660 [Gemmatimonadota bacterium]|nr:hypothetical protein [Gemmatimonadota bacterium]